MSIIGQLTAYVIRQTITSRCVLTNRNVIPEYHVLRAISIIIDCVVAAGCSIGHDTILNYNIARPIDIDPLSADLIDSHIPERYVV